MTVLIAYEFHCYSLSKLLHPTLISACYRVEENVAILEQEISCKLLIAFLQESLAKEKKMTEAKKASDTQGRDGNMLC